MDSMLLNVFAKVLKELNHIFSSGRPRKPTELDTVPLSTTPGGGVEIEIRELIKLFL